MRYCKELARVSTCTKCGCQEGCYIKQDQDEFGDMGYYPTTNRSEVTETEDDLEPEAESPE